MPRLRQESAHAAEDEALLWCIRSVWFFWSIRSDETNQMNQTDEIDRIVPEC